MSLIWKIDECFASEGRMHLGGWCFDDRMPIVAVEVVFSQPLVIVPLSNYRLPSPDVAAAVNPLAEHNRFDDWINIPSISVGRMFRLQFTLSNGTIVLGNSDIPRVDLQPTQIRSPIDELEIVKRREAEFRAKMVQEFLDRGERNTYLHALREQITALNNREQEASSDVENLVRKLEMKEGRVESLEMELYRIKSSTTWRMLAPLRAVRRCFARLVAPERMPTARRNSSAEGSVFTYYLHTSPFRIYREHSFTLRGWAWPEDGRAITAIRVKIDDSSFVGRHGIEEQEVVIRYGIQPANPKPGFEVVFDTPPGSHSLSLEAELDGTEWRAIMKTSIWCEPTAI
jgi:hypothetical protein